MLGPTNYKHAEEIIKEKKATELDSTSKMKNSHYEYIHIL